MLFNFLNVLLLSFSAMSDSAPACEPKDWDMVQHPNTRCFRPHSDSTVRAILMHYGNAIKTADLDRLKPLLVKQFSEATGGLLHLEILETKVVPLKVQERDLEAIAKEVPGTDDKRDPARLTRLWYYYKKGGTPLYREIHEEMLRAGMAVSMKNADAVLVLSEAQFEGLGYAQGAFAITEQPTEIAWGTKDGGWTKLEPDARLLDELIHELGHILGLDHPSKQCDLSKIEGPDKMKAYYECCEQSPGGKDVMSYCRSRGKVKDDFFYSFTECTRSFLRTETLPSLYWGDRKPRQTSACL